MEWLTGTSGALRRARQEGASKWKHPAIGAVLLLPLVYAVPLASWSLVAGVEAGAGANGGPVFFAGQILVAVSIVLVLFAACGVIAYRMFGLPVWASLACALAVPLLINLGWVVSLGMAPWQQF
jgi:hypothetical protein